MKTILLITLATAALFAGCNASPLLNHEDERVRGQADVLADPMQKVSAPKREGCPMEFKKFAACAQLDWIKHQVSQEEQGEFLLTFWKKADKTPFAPEHRVFVKLWMKSMSHPSTNDTETEALKDGNGNVIPGAFVVKRVYFSMNGEWEVYFQLLNGPSVVEQVTLYCNSKEGKAACRATK